MILSQLIGLWKYKASLLSNISWTFQTQNWPIKQQPPQNGQKHTLFDHFVGLSLKGLKTLNHSISCLWLPSIHPDIRKHNVKEVFTVDFERLWDLLKTFCLACFSKSGISILDCIVWRGISDQRGIYVPRMILYISPTPAVFTWHLKLWSNQFCKPTIE